MFMYFVCIIVVFCLFVIFYKALSFQTVSMTVSLFVFDFDTYFTRNKL